MTAPLLEVQNLVIDFELDEGSTRAVDGVSFSVNAGEAVAIVGESGSGKSVTSLAIMGLLPTPPARIRGGRIVYQSADLLNMEPRRRRSLSGSEIAMVYQDSMASLNPSLTVGQQITQVVRHHKKVSRAAATVRAAELLELVGISDARARLSDYPHQFSGGQRQRVLIAMALSCDPKVLIADEPTTALDVTIQAQIIELVVRLRKQLGMAVIWVTHDLGVVAGLVDRVVVMYAGRVVEEAPVHELFASPSHPYTIGLLRSLPRFDGGDEPLMPIPGGLPDMSTSIAHCAFAARCERATERCHAEIPALAGKPGARQVACFHPAEVTA
jgi:oligopeptide transport system ATP-binding protein